METNSIKTEELLTVKELSRRIKYKEQSLYNLIYKKVFVKGKHYLKPSHKRILFKWSEILKWLGEKDYYQKQETKVFDSLKKPNKNNLIKKSVLKKGRIKI